MPYDEKLLQELRDKYGEEVEVRVETGIHYIFIPGLKLPEGSTPSETDALLCPVPVESYASRLYLKDRVGHPKSSSGRPNWQQSRVVMGEEWHYYSFNGVQQGNFVSMVNNHLRGLLGQC